MIVREILDSVKPPDSLKKVAYQFVRRGDYDDVHFDKTEILRFEFSELKPNIDLADQSVGGGVLDQVPDDGVGETLLGKNQFIDIDTGMLVTMYSTEITT